MNHLKDYQVNVQKLVHLSTTLADGAHTEEIIDRKTAAQMIRISRMFSKRTGTTVTRVLRTSHVVIRCRNGATSHLTWAESEQRTQARLAKEASALEWRRSVL